MLAKIIGEQVTYRAVNTDCAIGLPGENVGVGQEPEDSGDRIWVLDAIQYSYKGSPLVDGGLIVRLDEKVKLDIDLIEPSGSLNLYIPSQTDKVIFVVLKSGGAGVVGKLNCQWHLEAAV